MNVSAMKDLYSNYKWYLEIFSELLTEFVGKSNLKTISNITSRV